MSHYATEVCKCPLFLPRETYKNRGKTFKAVFGAPIPYTVFDKSKTPSEWAAWVREEVYKL